MSGLNVNFQAAPDSNEQLEQLLIDGAYTDLIIHYSDYLNLDIPENMNVVLIGGPESIQFDDAVQLVYSDTKALGHAGAYLHKKWSEEGIQPLLIFWEDPLHHDENWAELLGTWPVDELSILTENRLVLKDGETHVPEKLEAYFSAIDFNEETEYLLLSYTPPYMADLLRGLPDLSRISYILPLPDSETLTEQCVALITTDYKNILFNSIESVKSFDGPERKKLDNIFLEQ